MKWTYPLLIPAKIPLEFIDGTEQFLKIALKYRWALKSRRSMQAFFKEHPEYGNLPRDLAKGLLEIMGSMCEISEEQETVDMCKVWQEWREDGVKKGREEGREQGARDFAAYLKAQSMPVRKVRSTLRKWFRLATKDLDKICPLL